MLCQATGDTCLRYNPTSGEQVWDTAAWESIRSDSHQLSFRIGTDALWVQGSPARVMGDGDAIFGSGAYSELNLIGCVDRMSAYAFQQFGIK